MYFYNLGSQEEEATVEKIGLKLRFFLVTIYLLFRHFVSVSVLQFQYRGTNQGDQRDQERHESKSLEEEH